MFKDVLGYYYIDAFSSDMIGGDIIYPNRVATFDLDSTKYNVPFIQNFPLFRPATIKIRVVTSVDNFQFLTVNSSYGKVSKGIILNGGRYIDTTFSWKTAGDVLTFIQADAVGHGVDIHKKDSLVIPANTTGNIEISL
jgi:hypothetical protein